MTPPPHHPTLFRYLRSVQRSEHVGVHSFFRRGSGGPRSARTVYRWQRSLGDQLLIVPNVLVEAVGLRHAHVFVSHPNPSWFSLAYAVEAAVVTPDFCREVYYLHCLVPTTVDFTLLLDALPCAHYAVFWSGSGWQQLLVDEEPITLPVATSVSVPSLLHRHPFLVPAMMEVWTYPNSLPVAWSRILHRLQHRIKEYLPRTRIRYVNGKTHLTSAFRTLREHQLVHQHIIRYHPLLAASVEVFVRIRMEREDIQTLLQRLRPVLHAIEAYPMTEGYWCRLLGPHQLLDAIMHLPMEIRERCGDVYFHTKRHPVPTVRFGYETTFDPATGAWRA